MQALYKREEGSPTALPSNILLAGRPIPSRQKMLDGTPAVPPTGSPLSLRVRESLKFAFLRPLRARDWQPARAAANAGPTAEMPFGNGGRNGANGLGDWAAKVTYRAMQNGLTEPLRKAKPGGEEGLPKASVAHPGSIYENAGTHESRAQQAGLLPPESRGIEI
ncbi:hypothetical protein CIHG_01340 [Coccidioides immitis H538.4]|uniref:Uncharacterized protein n=1 Tax=Coccidioides immitis H538.4 TaxID=396776 RepID=A0A0J8RF44_COCIT|nr:hypothetical protein CIHG_01340 [Coccidioides immitis H538.4]